MLKNAGKAHRTFFAIFLMVLIVLCGVVISNEIKRGRYIGLGAEKTYTISVSGEGKVEAKPDLAKVNLTVWTEGYNLSSVQKDNTEKMNNINAFLKEQGIEEKDLTTTQYTIYPQYDYTEEGRRFRGYRITQTLEVKIHDFSKIGTVLDEAVNKGANEVGNLAFTVEKKDQFEEEAREKAIKEAKNKARALADDLGVKLGRLTSYSESGQEPYPRPVYMEKAVPQGMGGGAAPEIEPGQAEIIKNITLTYEIVD